VVQRLPRHQTYISDALWIPLQSDQLFWIDDRHVVSVSSCYILKTGCGVKEATSTEPETVFTVVYFAKLLFYFDLWMRHCNPAPRHLKIGTMVWTRVWITWNVGDEMRCDEIRRGRNAFVLLNTETTILSQKTTFLARSRYPHCCSISLCV
jgi:hypothetical protein